MGGLPAGGPVRMQYGTRGQENTLCSVMRLLANTMMLRVLLRDKTEPMQHTQEIVGWGGAGETVHLMAELGMRRPNEF